MLADAGAILKLLLLLFEPSLLLQSFRSRVRQHHAFARPTFFPGTFVSFL